MALKLWTTAWSAVGALAIGQSALAVQTNYVQQVILSSADSTALYNRLTIQPASETFNGYQVSAKRFANSDGSFRIDCASAKVGFDQIACAITLDTMRAQPAITDIQPGYLAGSVVFQLKAKADVSTLLQNLGVKNDFVASETVSAQAPAGNQINVPRFRLTCPPDWVFDVVSCDGYVILR